MTTALQTTACLKLITDCASREMPATMPAPSRIVEKGTPVSSRSPAPRHADTLLFWDSGLARGDELPRHLLALCGLLRGHRAFFDDRTSAGDELSIVVSLASESGQGGAVLTAETLATLAACGVDVVLDLYPPPAPDTASSP